MREALQRVELFLRGALSATDFSKSFSWAHGEPATLFDARFGRTAGVLAGLYPQEFLRRHQAGIFFLDEFAPHKRPLLLMHGYCGYPQEFALLLRKLKRLPEFSEAHQVWVLQYPSAHHPEANAAKLEQALETMHARLRFDKLDIVAHSMGGLVARAMLREQTRKGKLAPWMHSLTTVATPFGGFSSAGVGARYSPLKVPVWDGLDPDGSFLQRLFEPALPKSFPYFLCSARRSKQASDGVVPEASQLRLAAVREARAVKQLLTSHVGALSHDQTVELITRALSLRAPSEVR